MRIAWRTVGAIIARVWADTDAGIDRFAGLRRIGIDEISYKRGHQYLTVVVDHDSGRLVWAAPGRDMATLRRVLRRARARRACAQITHVSADGADWIADGGRRAMPGRGALRGPVPRRRAGPPTPSTRCAARPGTTPARRRITPQLTARRTDAAHRASGQAKALKSARYALWKNPENLTDRQRQARLDRQDRPPAAPGLPAQRRPPARLPARPPTEAADALDRWLAWARRCRIPRSSSSPNASPPPTRDPRRHRHGLSNGRIESVNTKIRLITRIAFGFHSPDALIALAMLNLGGHRPALPGH